MALLCCFVLSLVMAPKVSRKFKTKANRNPRSSPFGSALIDKVRFLSAKCEETYETLTKYWSIWGERELVLSELDLSIHRNFVSRNWVSSCEVSILLLQLCLESFTLTSLSILRLQVVITWLPRSVVKSLPSLNKLFLKL